MTTLIVLPDLHDHPEALKRIARPLMQANVVVLAGDMTNGSTNHLLRLFAILEDLNEHVYAVPGNMDTFGMQSYLAREGISLHRRFEMVDGLALVGLGGALPFEGRFVFTEEETAQLLDDAIERLPAGTPMVLISHQPPYDTALDRLPSGVHVGSRALRAWIERVQPLACVCGHVHEATGTDQLGRTLLLNPGPLWQTDAYAWLNIEDGRILGAEIRHAQPQTAPVEE